MKSYFRILLFIVLTATATTVSAQTQSQPESQPQSQTQSQPAAPPSTDIYLADLKLVQGSVTIGKPTNVTHRKGYDNQPFFLPDGQSFFFTVIGEDEQADTYRYDIKTETRVRVI